MKLADNTVKAVIEKAFSKSWVSRKLKAFLAAFPQYTADSVIVYKDEVWYDLYWFHNHTRDTLAKMLKDGYIPTEADQLLEASTQETLRHSEDIIPEPAKSKTHVCFHDGYEYLLFNGDYYRAPVTQPIECHTGNRGARFECTLAHAKASEMYSFLFPVKTTDIEDQDDTEWFTKPVERKAVEGEMCVYGLNGRDAYALSAPVTSDSKDYPVQRIDKEHVIINGKEYIDSHFVWQGVRIYTPVCQDIVEDMGELPDIAPQMPQAAREYEAVMSMTYAEAFPDADTVAEEGIYLPSLEELGLATATLEAEDDYFVATDLLNPVTELIATTEHLLPVEAEWMSAGGTVALVGGRPFHLEDDGLYHPLMPA